MNIIQQAEQLKDISDDRIAQEMRQPTGIFPLYLVSSEAKRRADLRQRFKTDQVEAPQTTVQQDLLTALAGQTQPPAIPAAAQQQGAPGAQPLPPRATPPMPQAPPRMAPQMPPQMAPQMPSRMPPRMPPQIPPGNPGVGNVPTRGFAEGGMVRGFQNGSRELAARDSFLNKPFSWIYDKVINPAFTGATRAKAKSVVDNPNVSLWQKNQARRALGIPSFDPNASMFANVPTEYDSQSPFPNIPEGRPVPPKQPIEINPNVAQAAMKIEPPRPPQNFGPLADFYDLPQDSPMLSEPPAPPAQPQALPAPPGVAFPPAPTFTPLPGAAGAGVKPLGDFTQLMDAREAKIAASRGDPYKKFADIMAQRAEAVGDAETRNKWLAVARAGFEMAGGQSQYALTNIGKGLGEGLTEYTKGQTAIDARRDKNLALDMQLTGVQEKLKSEISTIAMAQAKGEIDTQTANARIALKQKELENTRITQQNLNKERLAGHAVKEREFQQRSELAGKKVASLEKIAEMQADLKREGIASREKIAKTQAEAGGPFYKDWAAIEKNIKDPVKRAAAHRAYIESRRGASPMRITRSHVAAMTNKLNKRTAALMANRGTLMISEPVLETLRNTKVGRSTVYEIISGTVKSTPAEKKEAENHVKAWAQSEHMNDPQFLEMLGQRLILRPGASQAQKGWGAVRQKSGPAAP